MCCPAVGKLPTQLPFGFNVSVLAPRLGEPRWVSAAPDAGASAADSAAEKVIFDFAGYLNYPGVAVEGTTVDSPGLNEIALKEGCREGVPCPRVPLSYSAVCHGGNVLDPAGYSASPKARSVIASCMRR